MRPDSGGAAGAPWAPLATATLGTWLASGAFTITYASSAMKASDLACGAGIVLFAALSSNPRRGWARWANAALGSWLLLAPLVFWADAASAHVDTLVGCAVVLLSVVLPGAPGDAPGTGSGVPPGWSYNPSSPEQRAPVVAMALMGFYLSRVLAAYQMGHIDRAWDPFFGEGTRRVLESDVSKAFPVSDAGLGAASYLVEALTGCIGGRSRWRTMPWMVVLFGFLVVPLGVVSIVLVILQPVSVGAWCTLCLVTALAMLVMVGPAADELIATAQVLGARHRAGRSFWDVFWKGAPAGAEKASAPGSGPGWISSLGISRVTWSLAAAALAGAWLLVSPAAFGSTGAAADNAALTGALAVTFSVIGLADITRSARWLTVVAGGWILLSTWFLEGQGVAARVNGALAGATLIALSLPRGRVEGRFGGWERYIV